MYAKRPRLALGKKQSKDASRTQMLADRNSGKLCANQKAGYLQAAFEPATCLEMSVRFIASKMVHQQGARRVVQSHEGFKSVVLKHWFSSSAL